MWCNIGTLHRQTRVGPAQPWQFRQTAQKCRMGGPRRWLPPRNAWLTKTVNVPLGHGLLTHDLHAPTSIMQGYFLQHPHFSHPWNLLWPGRVISKRRVRVEGEAPPAGSSNYHLTLPPCQQRTVFKLRNCKAFTELHSHVSDCEDQCYLNRLLHWYMYEL